MNFRVNDPPNGIDPVTRRQARVSFAGMKAVQTFTVVSNLPEPLEPLHEVAMNLGWINDERAQDLFRRMDRENWDYVRDPARLLATEPQERLDELAADTAF